MQNRPADLPDFERPPLVEVVLSVQFAELGGYRTLHAGLLWERKFREAYPEFSEHAPLDPVFETFGSRSPAEPRFEIRQLAGPPVPRVWLINPDKTELIQIQADRFVHNWRKVGRADYPRYEHLKDRFFERLRQVEAFAESEGIGKIEPNQCEITYVNVIRVEGGADVRTRPEAALRCWSRVEADSSDPLAKLPDMEDTRFSIRYVMESQERAPIGRLLVSVAPAIGEPALRLDLTARGAPSAASLIGVSDFLDLGRDTIVRTFTALTTPEMHKIWGRVQ